MPWNLTPKESLFSNHTMNLSATDGRNYSIYSNLLDYSTTLAPVIATRSTEELLVMQQYEFVKSIYEWMIPSMILILLLAIVGNGLIVVSAPSLSPPVSPYLRLCVSLAAADMWAASLLIAGLLVNSYMPVVMGIQKKTFCADAILEIFRVSGMLTSAWHLFGLAINQFVGTMWPLKYRMIVTTRRVRGLIVALWVVPLLFTFGWFISFENDGLRNSECIFDFYNRLPFRLTVFLLFTLPLLATLVLYGLILTNLFKAKAEFEATLSDAKTPCVNRGRISRRSHVHSKLRLVWTTLLIVSTFSLSWGACVLYFTLICKSGCVLEYRVSLSFYLSLSISSIVNCLVMIKLALNPFIYTLRIKAIHNSVYGFLRRLKSLALRTDPLYPHKSSYSRGSKRSKHIPVLSAIGRSSLSGKV